MKKILKMMSAALLTFSLTLTGVFPQVAGFGTGTETVYGAQKLVYLNKSYVNIVPGNSYKLNLYSGKKNISKKAKWTSSKKSAVSVNKAGRIKAKDAGKVVITASYGGKTYRCGVTSAYKDYEEIYDDTLNALYNRINGWNVDSDALAGGFVGIAEFIGGDTGDAALRKIGYTIMDINADAVPELIVTGITKRGKKYCFADDICLIYTYAGKKSVEVASGWARSGYRLMDDGHLYYHGSSGAMYTLFGDYSLAPGGEKLTCKDFYFSSDEGNTNFEIYYYHNTEGFADVSSSKKLDITSDSFGKLMEGYEKRCRRIEVTPFSDFPVDVFSSVSEDIAIYESTDGYEEYYQCSASDSEYGVDVIVAANNTVTDFKVSKITWKDSGIMLVPELSAEPLFSVEKLTPDKPLKLTVEFPGDTPAYAITYKNKKGVEKTYGLTMSGMDGSIVLTDI